MGTPSVSTPSDLRTTDWYDDPRRWLFGGLAALFVFLGLGIFLAIVIPVLQGNAPAFNFSVVPWTWIWQLVIAIVTIWAIIWVVRMVIWGVAGPYESRRYRRAWRHYRDWGLGYDPALGTARERYARGEITREQFEQLERDLARGFPQPPPPPA